MTDHLSQSVLNALADGELSHDQLLIANEHLADCPSCTSTALYLSLLKSATARAGQRYTAPAYLRDRLVHLASGAPESNVAHRSSRESAWPFGLVGWSVAAALLLLAVSIGLIQRSVQHARLGSTEHAALVTEIFDQHIATLASGSSPQVLSSDRHTVKPWFQGKIPFSFNLPETLPNNTVLEGANLTYLHGQPIAQLLYSIGKHRVSVFVRQKSGALPAPEEQTERSGFHVVRFNTGDLEMIAISDVDSAHLAELDNAIRQAQVANPKASH